MTRRHLRASFLPSLLALVSLAGCDLTLPWSTAGGDGGSRPGAPRITLETGTVQFGLLTSAAGVGGRSVAVTVSGQGIAAIGVGAATGLPSWLQAGLSPSGAGAVLTLSVPLAPDAPGPYAVTLEVAALDAANHVLASALLDVALAVVARPTAGPLPVELAWLEQQGPGPHDLTVTHDPRVTLGEVQVDVPWLAVSRAGDTVTLAGNPASAARAAGTYPAQLSIAYAFGASAGTLVVPVQATVLPALAGPASLTFSVGPQTVAAGLAQTATVSSQVPGGLAFTATADVPWLTATGGATGATGNLGVSLVPGALADLPSGTHAATVTVAPSVAGLSPLLIPVTLTLSLPTVVGVSPVAYSDDATDHVVVRGVGFTAPGFALAVGGEAAQGVTIVSDTELRLVPGARAAGTYAVSASNALGIARPAATLFVVDPPPYGTVAVEAPFGDVERVVASARHRSVYAAKCYFCSIGSGTTSRVLRYAYDTAGGTWSASAHDYPLLWDVALTLDEEHLVVLTTANLLLVNPVTLATEQTIPLPAEPSGTAPQLAVTNDGLILVQTLRKAWSLREGRWVGTPWLLFGLGLGASRDGGRVIFGEATNSGDVPYWSYDASTGTASASATREHFARGKLSRHGERGFVNSWVLGPDLGVLQSLPVWSHTGDLSPDGRRAYGWDANARNLRRVDLSGAPPFPELTAITVTDPGGIVRTATDPSGRFVFLVGEQRFVVVDVR